MARNDRARRRALALMLAMAVHAGLLAGFIAAQRPVERFAETPAMNVALVAPPAGREPEPARRTPQTPHRPSTEAPEPIREPPPDPPQSTAAAPVSDADRAALFQAPLRRRPPPPGPRLR